MSFKSRCLSFVDWNIFRHNILPFHSFLPGESTNHNRNIHTSAGLDNISCYNNSCSAPTKRLKNQQENDPQKSCDAVKIETNQMNQLTHEKWKCGINQLLTPLWAPAAGVISIMCRINSWSLQSITPLASNHGNKSISILCCPTKKKVQQRKKVSSYYLPELP